MEVYEILKTSQELLSKYLSFPNEFPWAGGEAFILLRTAMTHLNDSKTGNVHEDLKFSTDHDMKYEDFIEFYKSLRYSNLNLPKEEFLPFELRINATSYFPDFKERIDALLMGQFQYEAYVSKVYHDYEEAFITVEIKVLIPPVIDQVKKLLKKHFNVVDE